MALNIFLLYIIKNFASFFKAISHRNSLFHTIKYNKKEGSIILVKEPYIGMPIILGTDSENPDGCGCSGGNANNNTGNTGPDGTFDSMYLGQLPLAMCYVPMQHWNTTYSLDKSLERGTIFPELDLPFLGGMKR